MNNLLNHHDQLDLILQHEYCIIMNEHYFFTFSSGYGKNPSELYVEANWVVDFP